MNKIILILFSVLLIFLGILVVIFTRQGITGEVIKDIESFTSAICNETNFCQDYEVTCQDGKFLNMIPISGAVTQYSPKWKDPRNNTNIENLC